MTLKVGTFGTTTQAAGNNVVVSGLGFTPDLVLFFWSGRTAVGIANLQERGAGHGMALSATERRACCTHIGSGGSYWSGRSHHNAACIITSAVGLGGVAETDGAMDFVSLDTDGFTLVIDDAFPGDFQVGYVAFEGLDAVAIGTLTEPAATGLQTISGVGFQPNLVLFLSTSDATAPPAQDNHAKLMIGAMTSQAQYVTAILDHDNQGIADSYHYTFNGECVALGTDGAGTDLNGRAAFSAMTSDGFTLNWLERAGSRLVFWLALKGANLALGDILSATDLNNFSETGIGFPPQGLIFFSSFDALSTQDTKVADLRLSVGAATGPSARFSFAEIKDNGITDHNEVHRTTEVYGSFADTSGSPIDGEMDFVSLDSDGFTAVMDDADASARFIWYIAFNQLQIAPRNRLVKYLHNTYISREAGRPIVHDVLGREVPVEQLQADQWLYADGPLLLTSARPQSLIADPRAYYIESLTTRGDRADIVTAREGLLENLFRRLSRSG